jgi:hypothetical protein
MRIRKGNELTMGFLFQAPTNRRQHRNACTEGPADRQTPAGKRIQEIAVLGLT